MTTILVVEDDTTLREALVYNLKKEEYGVCAVGDGLAAIEKARSTKPDLIILDVNLPGVDGFEVCRNLRRDMQMPILMLTARYDEIDRVVGLEIGADDYITKPFSMRELMARIKSHLRRERIHTESETAPSPVESQDKTLKFDDLTINQIRHEATLADKTLALKPKEFELLLFLAQHVGRALSRDYLLEHVWGWDYAGNTRTVDVHIRWLREKIEIDPSCPVRIITIRSSGYRFEG
jgi:DNA-binding response OmpR family regulator